LPLNILLFLRIILCDKNRTLKEKLIYLLKKLYDAIVLADSNGDFSK
jgi:hypothetical protein